MGFSTIAASVILFAALLFFSSTIANAHFEAERQQDRAKDDQRDRYEFERRTAFDIYNGKKTGNTVTLDATNTGATSLDTSRIHVLVDGVWSSGSITSLKVEGSTGYTTWSPGQNLELKVQVAGATARLWVVSETGYVDHWEG